MNLRSCAALLFAIFSLASLTLASATTYEYDADGRLRSATNSAGETAVYDYDALGNLQRIRRIGGAELTISTFAPSYGEFGQQVVISGTGFGATTSTNTIKFNGTSAAVLTASPTRLLAQVPLGATTGKISVTVGSTTVTGTDTFTVGVLGLPPTLTSFAPTSGNPGVAVTLNGTNLNPYPGQTTVEINGLFVPITTISDTQITFAIPIYVGSGKIAVTTGFGRAISTGILLVHPIGISPGSVQRGPALSTSGSAQSATLNTANTYAAFTFQGAEGDYLSLQVSAFSSSIDSLSYTVYSGTNTSIASGTLTSSNLSIHLPKIKRTATYSIYLGSGSGTTQFSVKLEKDTTVVPVGGASISSSTFLKGQSKRLLVSATGGDNLGIGINGLNIGANPMGYASVRLYDPDNLFLESTTCYVSYGSCEIDVRSATRTGYYNYVVSPTYGADTMSFTNTATKDVAVTHSASTPVAMSLGRLGQNGRVSFSGTAGTMVAVQVSGISTAPAGRLLNLTMYRADGTSQAYDATTSGTTFNFRALPATEIYTIFIDPEYGVTANVSVRLLPSATAMVAVDSATRDITTALGGQDAYFSFTGTAGDNLGIGISNFVKQNGDPSYPYARFMVYAPDGRGFTSPECYPANGGCDKDLLNLPLTGTYFVIVQSPSPTGEPNLTMSFTATVSRNLTATLSPEMPLPVNLSRRGQNGHISFIGTAGTTTSLQIGAINAVPAGHRLSVTVLKPSGDFASPLASTDTATGHTFYLNLLTTGTYSLYIDPEYGAAANLSVTLGTSVPASAPMVVDGSPSDISTTLSGEEAYLRFTGTAGDNLGLGISNLRMQNSHSSYPYVQVRVYKPDGRDLMIENCYLSVDGCGLDLEKLPATGTYSVIVKSANPSLEPNLTMTFTATVSRDLTGTLTASTPLSVNLSRRGQNGRLTFAGTVDTSVTLQVDGISVPAEQYVGLNVLDPDGYPLASAGSATNHTFNLNLPSTGSYTVYIDPEYGAATTMSVTLR